MFLLWLLAVVLVIYGIVLIIRGNVLLGVVLIILGLLIGPGGVSIFSTVSAAATWPSLSKGRTSWKSLRLRP